MGTRKPNQRSSIFEGADGYWHGYVTVGHKPDGRLDRRHLQATTEAGVTNRVRKLEQDRERGETKKAGRAPTVAAWMTTYLDTIAPQRVTPKTLDAYWSQATNWIIPNLGRHRLDRLAPEHLDRLYAVMLDAGRAPSMVLKTHRILSRALKIAHRRGHVNRNVALLVDPPSSPEIEQQQLTLAEARKVLAATAELRNGTRWSVALSAGLRQGEALGLRWEYVDLDTGDVKVWWQLQRNRWRHGCDDPHVCGERLHRPTCPKDCRRHATACPQRYGGGLVFRRPKGKSRRTVTLPTRLVDALREHKAAQDLERDRAGEQWQDQDLVFATDTGRPVDPRRDWEEWKTILREAGVREVRVHDMRHTAGTLLVAQGVHIRAVQEILGHSDVRTTQGYTHIGSEVARDAARRMDSALWSDDA